MRLAPSNLPPPRSPESAVSHVPPRMPPVYRMGFLPRTPAQYDSGEPATTIGPMRSGRIAAVIMVCQPAWQLGMTTGDLFDKRRLCAANVLDRLTRHRLGREADEVAWMAGADRHSNHAVGLHAPDAWPVAGARVDDDDRRFRRIDNSAFGWNDADKPIIGRARQLAPVKDELIGEVQHIRHFLRRLRSE